MTKTEIIGLNVAMNDIFSVQKQQRLLQLVLYVIDIAQQFYIFAQLHAELYAFRVYD